MTSGEDLKIFVDNFEIKNRHTKIIGYYKNNLNNLIANENKLFLLKKP